VKTAKLSVFSLEDMTEVGARLTETDPMLNRTVALLGSTPDAIRNWIAHAAQVALKVRFPDLVLDSPDSASVLFERIVRRCAADLDGKDRAAKRRAENLVRLALAWLLSSRNLRPLDALSSIRQARRKIADAKVSKVSRDLSTRLARSGLGRLLDLAAVVTLSEAAVADAERERSAAIGRLETLQRTVESLTATLDATKAELATASAKAAELANDLDSLRRELAAEKEARALDRTQRAARSRTFLKERVGRNLSDAHDALAKFDPPETRAAIQRLEDALAAIEREVSDRDG
jgi:hypothetical protein